MLVDSHARFCALWFVHMLRLGVDDRYPIAQAGNGRIGTPSATAALKLQPGWLAEGCANRTHRQLCEPPIGFEDQAGHQPQ